MSAQASAVLFTKLYRPPVTADRIERPRQIEQLNRGLQQGPLTLVCAAAGFGKTTLVSSWIESMAQRAGLRCCHSRLGCRWRKPIAARGAHLVFADASDHVRTELDLSGIADLVGQDAFFDDSFDVIEAYRKAVSKQSGGAVR